MAIPLRFESQFALRGFLEKTIPGISFEDLETLLAKWNKQGIIRKGERLESNPREQAHLYYILSGAFKASSENEESEMIFDFAWTGHCFFNLPRYLDPNDSGSFLECIHPAHVLAIALKDFLDFLKTNENAKAAWNKNLHLILKERIEREALFMHADAAKRIAWMNEKHPELWQQIPSVHLAAYLGIRPETLSRLKP